MLGMNKLPVAKRVQILSLLVEGSPLRSISRVCDVSINTVTKLLVDAGTVCATFHAANVKDVKPARHFWQLQTAKARFSEVFRLARTEGPQLITRQGKDAVVMMPVEQFDQLVLQSRQPKSLVRFFRESPLVGLEMDFERDKDTGRDIKL